MKPTSWHRFLPLQYARLALLFTALTVLGCGESGPKLVPLNGKVVLRSEPVSAGSVYLHPDAANEFQSDTPGSLLELDGSFNIKTFPFGDGVPVGRYKVTLSPDLAVRLKVPEYSNPITTPWQVEVGPEGNTSLLLEVVLPDDDKQ